MNLRNLLPSFALVLSAACNISVPNQFPCKTPGSFNECGQNQVCGTDLLCTNLVSCSSTQTRCNGNCVDKLDPLHCGEDCNNKCNDGDVCVKNGDAYACTPHCASGQTPCPTGTNSYACRDLSSDRANCGSCGNACPGTGLVCTPTTPGGPGHCAQECIPGLTNCSGNCFDIQRDNQNCGACGTVCLSGQACVSGICTTKCPGTQTICGGQCTSLATDRNNCAACGAACPAGQNCVGGACTLSCPAPLINCGTGTCVNPNNDPAHCGNCPTACATGQSCVVLAGVPTCSLVCPSGQTSCGGACANLQTDSSNCGACGTQCAPGQSCQSGSCKATCKPGFTDCGAVLGCVDTLNDANHCGVGSLGCAAAPCPAGKVCQAGVCTPTCRAGLSLCNGVCVDTSSDPNNCGTCLSRCPAGFACGGSTCQVACGSGSVSCNGTCVNTLTDNKNCGGCTSGGLNFACPAGSACDGTGRCAPTCGVGALGTPLLTCSGKCTDTASDAANCGACGRACAAGEVCRNSVCTVSCQAGLSPCPQSGGATACKDLTQDRTNCGTCGTVCSAGQVCALDSVSNTYKCSMSCQSPLTNCSGLCSKTSIDPQNCGACGTICPTGGTAGNATAYCSLGNCGLACVPGFADCDGIASNGCEVNTASDPLHCGGCAVKCPAPDNASPTTCAASVCQSGFACKAGFGDCDANPANGCEANLANDAAHCGGATCAASTACATSPFCGSGLCTATPAGVQQNVLTANLTGWTQCSLDTYGSGTTSIAALKTACKFGTAGVIWLMGCRKASSPGTLLVAAAGDPADILFATSGGLPRVVAGTGIEWYFDNGTWGFAPANAALSRGSSICDNAGSGADGFAGGFGSQRLCWNTSGGNVSPGQRCGNQVGVADASFERIVFYK